MPNHGNAHAEFEPRATCATCLRPTRVCYCRHLARLRTESRVVLLQHPRESRVPIGTARMASLCLEGAVLHVGVEWEGSKELEAALSDPSRPAALLYPGEGAIDVLKAPPEGPITLIVIDGTWWQARKVVRKNPSLAKLPRYAFAAPSPSEYRIRKEPDPTYVSTIEALVHVLSAIEPDGARFLALLDPFRAMVDAQIACARDEGMARHKKKTPRARREPRVPPVFHQRHRDLVCVVGEANAWPYEDSRAHPDELVQWVAHRPSTGETFEAFAAPRNPIAPMTTKHLAVDEETLRGGGTLEDLLERWRAFVRDDDVVCAWGHYAGALLLEEGGFLPRTRVDVRHAARLFARGKVGTLEDFVARIDETRDEAPMEARAIGSGRAGSRVAALSRVVAHLGRAATSS